ncbi:MAG: ATP-binding protein [Ignavibacteria bacterium]|nr:ATP-binding protein [Ignavibacteria bacterium]
MISHDFQEPLRMVSSYLQLLERKYKDGLDENAREYIRFAVDGSVRMKNMLEALLRYSRISSTELKPEIIDLEKILNKAITQIKSEYPEKKFRLSYRLSDEIKLVADPFLIQVLFHNLIENSVKFNENMIEITVEDFENDSKWGYIVSDNGIGIKTDYHDKIFGIFKRLNNNMPGTGVGLALCKKIVEKHGGEIWIEPMNNKGTKFIFTISKIH